MAPGAAGASPARGSEGPMRRVEIWAIVAAPWCDCRESVGGGGREARGRRQAAAEMADAAAARRETKKMEHTTIIIA